MALVLTFTRASFIALGAAVIVFLWLIRSHLLRPLRVAWFLAILAGLYLLVSPSLQRSTTFQEGIVRPGALTVRESYWSAALPIVTSSTHNFVLGTGLESLEAPRVGNNAYIPLQLAATPQVWVQSLHNQYVTTLVEQGLLGLLVLLAFLVTTFESAASVARRARDPVAAAVAATVLAMAVVMSVDTMLIVSPAFAMLMFAAGLSARLRDPKPAQACTDAREFGR